jgi:hypothetical protein
MAWRTLRDARIAALIGARIDDEGAREAVA